jgi:hypothetical protein
MGAGHLVVDADLAIVSINVNVPTIMVCTRELKNVSLDFPSHSRIGKDGMFHGTAKNTKEKLSRLESLRTDTLL